MPLKNISILMPVLNETWSLEQVCKIVIEENEQDIAEVIFVIHKMRTIPQSINAIEKVKKAYPQVSFKIIEQSLPFLGGAIRDGFDAAMADYVLMMACDLETDPKLVKEFIKQTKNKNIDIITASRWIKGGGFSGYNPLKKFCNKIFQMFFSILYGTKLTDMTYGFRIIKTSIIKSIKWEEIRHPIFFETLLKPIRMGYKVTEIPAAWEPRREGCSQVRMQDLFAYFITGFKIRFIDKEKWRKS